MIYARFVFHVPRVVDSSDINDFTKKRDEKLSSKQFGKDSEEQLSNLSKVKRNHSTNTTTWRNLLRHHNFLPKT
jgi:hypothetical protein